MGAANARMVRGWEDTCGAHEGAKVVTGLVACRALTDRQCTTLSSCKDTLSTHHSVVNKNFTFVNVSACF